MRGSGKEDQDRGEIVKTVVITEDGQLIEQTTASYTQALAAVGPEGFNTVQLSPFRLSMRTTWATDGVPTRREM